MSIKQAAFYTSLLIGDLLASLTSEFDGLDLSQHPPVSEAFLNIELQPVAQNDLDGVKGAAVPSRMEMKPLHCIQRFYSFKLSRILRWLGRSMSSCKTYFVYGGALSNFSLAAS